MQWVVWITISFPARDNTLLRQTSCCWQNGNDNKAMVMMKLDCIGSIQWEELSGWQLCLQIPRWSGSHLISAAHPLSWSMLMMPARCAFQMCRWNCLSPLWLLDKCTCSLSTFRALWGTWARYSETPLVATARWHLSTCSGPIFDPPAVTMTR